jgi:hypothetical protein
MEIKVMKSQKKVVVFNEVLRCFVRYTTANTENNKNLFCEKTRDAVDFVSVSNARCWAEGSGFSSLVVLTVSP